MFHIVLHFIVPGIIAVLFYREMPLKAWLILMATMAVDLDHLLANPIYDPSRCSIGFHPLHSYIAMGVYLVFLFIPRLRLIGIGLVIHMALDYVDCFL